MSFVYEEFGREKQAWLAMRENRTGHKVRNANANSWAVDRERDMFLSVVSSGSPFARNGERINICEFLWNGRLFPIYIETLEYIPARDTEPAYEKVSIYDGLDLKHMWLPDEMESQRDTFHTDLKDACLALNSRSLSAGRLKLDIEII
jgi:hypothetical protein